MNIELCVDEIGGMMTVLFSTARIVDVTLQTKWKEKTRSELSRSIYIY